MDSLISIYTPTVQRIFLLCPLFWTMLSKLIDDRSKHDGWWVDVTRLILRETPDYFCVTETKYLHGSIKHETRIKTCLHNTLHCGYMQKKWPRKYFQINHKYWGRSHMSRLDSPRSNRRIVNSSWSASSITPWSHSQLKLTLDIFNKAYI